MTPIDTSTWTEEQRGAYEKVANHLLHEQAELARVEAEAAAALASPEVLTAALRAQVDEAKRKRERAERAAAGEKAWILARAEYGDGVARVDMEAEGDVLIVHHMTEVEIEGPKGINARARRLQDAVLAGLAPDASDADRRAAKARGLREAVGAQLDAVILKTEIGGLDSAAARVRLKALCARYAFLCAKLFEVRDALVTGYRVAEGKGSALS